MKAGSVAGSELVTLEEVAEDMMLAKLLAVMDNASHPLQKTLDKHESSFRTHSRHRKSFVPGAIRLYKAHSTSHTHIFVH